MLVILNPQKYGHEIRSRDAVLYEVLLTWYIFWGKAPWPKPFSRRDDIQQVVAVMWLVVDKYRYDYKALYIALYGIT